jgi:beta-galactosidase
MSIRWSAGSGFRGGRAALLSLGMWALMACGQSDGPKPEIPNSAGAGSSATAPDGTTPDRMTSAGTTAPNGMGTSSGATPDGVITPDGVTAPDGVTMPDGVTPPSDGPQAIPTDRVRTVLPFDAGWLFFLGDANGADQPEFADQSWRALDVPHDWSIEGPFEEGAATLGEGGFAPSGVGWYRKHFSLPAELSGRRIFIEFDGVMANSRVSINGAVLGTRPNGYVGFRYEITDQVTFGATDNVVAVRADNTPQPASRWYTGAGIYRHVRLVATDPIHVAHAATFVTTPVVSPTAATVRVQTTVINQGTAPQSVAVVAQLRDPTGRELSPVSAPAQNIAGGASVDFAIDVSVSDPLLWSTTTPNLYELVANVQVGDATLDDDVVSFGVRSIEFDPETGFSLNGENMKFKGVAIHHDVSGLGAAVPLRAWQRRLAQLEAIGVNAIRTSHNPFAPEVLDLCDRMGILVMDEFFDAWIGQKPGIVAAYAGDVFREWSEIDLRDTVMRDRNHPSVVIYSIGNEIRDSLAVRLPIATDLIATIRDLDPTRPVTQALFRPRDNADYPGAMLDLLDVFGVNYRILEAVEAIALEPRHVGILTEMGPNTADWATILATPALTGEFLWTGFDYLGEVQTPWPTISADFGIMDRMGTPKAIGRAYQALWSSNPVVLPATGTVPSQIVLTADHPTVVVDPNDVSYIKASIADSSGNLVTSASNPVTFEVTGPGKLVAVDSGSLTNESFRGNLRNAFQGLSFAIIQATGPGTITVSASTPGLAAASVTVASSAGPFVPCAGSCD